MTRTPGYYIEKTVDSSGANYNGCVCTVICINSTENAMYVNSNDAGWIRLDKRCIPSVKRLTRVHVATTREVLCSLYDYYPTFQDFIANNKLSVPGSSLVKSLNDDFSP